MVTTYVTHTEQIKRSVFTMRKQPDILKILIIVFAGLIAAFAVFAGIYLTTASKKLKAVELSPDFIETELEVGTQYNFTLKTTPAKASTKKLECVVDDPNCTFELAKNGKVTLTTGINEGTVTVYVESKGIKSQVLTFAVVDSVARARAEAEAAAAAQAEAEAQAAEAEAAEAEAEAQTKYVQCVAEDVRVRAQNNTDCDVLGKAKKGDTFEKVEDVDDWTHIIYQGQDGYMKTEFLQEISEEEAMAARETAVAEPEETKKEETKKEEEKKPDETQSKAEAEAKAAAAAAAEAEAAAAAAQAELEAQQALLAAAAAAGPTIECKDGPHTFTQQQYNFIQGFWSYTGDWQGMAHKHTYDELKLICQIEGGIN